MNAFFTILKFKKKKYKILKSKSQEIIKLWYHSIEKENKSVGVGNVPHLQHLKPHKEQTNENILHT